MPFGWKHFIEYTEWYSPEQKKRNFARMVGVIEKDDFSVLQVTRPHVSYFNRSGQAESKCLYDVFYHPEIGFDQKLQRCDRKSERQAKKGINKEEMDRVVPVITSSEYGKRRTDLEGVGVPLGNYKRSNVVKEFKRRNKINLKPDEGLPLKIDKYF